MTFAQQIFACEIHAKEEFAWGQEISLCCFSNQLKTSWSLGFANLIFTCHESWTHNRKVASSSLGPIGNCRWRGVNVQLDFTLNTTTEVPLSKAPNPQLLPGHRNINGCPLLRVCVHGVCVFTDVCGHIGWVNAEHKFWVWVTILGCMSHHFHNEINIWIAIFNLFNKKNNCKV